MTNNLRRAFEARQEVLKHLREAHRALILKDPVKFDDSMHSAQSSLDECRDSGWLMHYDDEGNRVDA